MRPPPPLPLRTARVVLRAARPDDGPALLAYYGDPAVARYLPFEPLDAAGVQVRLTRYLTQVDPALADEALNLVVERDGVLIGDVMLQLKGTASEPGPPSVGEVGWAFDPAYAGHGYATEAARAVLDLAFGHYGLHRVAAQLDPRNTASARLCERLGMTREADLRRDYWCKGEWADTTIYGLLAEEWAPVL